MMSWTLYILLVTQEGHWQSLKSREYTKPGHCQKVAQGLKGKPISNGTIYTAVCKETINT